jgi:uncharacterized membrane protein
MATLVAIAYPGEGTAEQARQTVQGLEADVVIHADQVAAISRDAAHVWSKRDEKRSRKTRHDSASPPTN